MTKQKPTNESVEGCKSIFVTWTWAVGIVTGLLTIGISIAWAASAKMSTIDNTLTDQTELIYLIERQVSNTDTIIAMLKDMRNDRYK
jgi:hypothetical protein